MCKGVCVCALGKSAQSARVAATIKKPFGFVGAGKYATKCERASRGALCRLAVRTACCQCQPVRRGKRGGEKGRERGQIESALSTISEPFGRQVSAIRGDLQQLQAGAVKEGKGQ